MQREKCEETSVVMVSLGRREYNAIVAFDQSNKQPAKVTIALIHEASSAR